ncbi:MAG: ATP-dependent DNA helicase [Ignavibacteriales bacterium]
MNKRTLNFTDSQFYVWQGITKFLSGSEQCCIIKGYAGTGKTYLIGCLADYLSETEIPFRLMAPTGRAAKILASKTNRAAFTVHKSIYNMQNLSEFKSCNEWGEETFKYYFRLRNGINASLVVYIVDESSMISDNYSEGEFFRFGSGRLLQDFIEYTKVNYFPENVKVIFIGDNAQLPPVNSSLSPALSPDYLKSRYGLRSIEYEMTDVVRQKKDSLLLANATRFREYIRTETFNEFSINTDNREIIDIAPDMLLENYFRNVSSSSLEDTIIIAYTNQSVSYYNKLIRDKLFPNEASINVGDRIIVVANNYKNGIELLNGEFGVIKEVAPENEIRRTPIIIESETFYVENTFREVVIGVKTPSEGERIIRCKIIENLLLSENSDLTSHELRALYIDFKIRHRELEPESPDFEEALKNDQYFNAVRIKYGYAVTCHKAQGGEWDTVFVDFTSRMGMLNESYFRWVYTAMTRSKKKVFTINRPEISAIRPAISHNYAEGLEIISGLMAIPELTVDDETEETVTFPENPPFLKSLYRIVKSICRQNSIMVTKLMHFDFCERYFLQLNEASFYVNFWYNKHGRIQKIDYPDLLELTKCGDNPINLQSLFSEIERKMIPADINQDSVKTSEFPADKPFLKEIFAKISLLAEGQNMEIRSVEHLFWRERYTFQKGKGLACLDLLYNSRGSIIRLEPKPDRTNSGELLEEILRFLSEHHQNI